MSGPEQNNEKALPERRQKKSGWEIFDIVAKPTASLLTALAIALLGYWGQRTISSIAAMDQNARLYTELLSKREQSESSLRKDMFTLILKDFFGADNGGSPSAPASSAEISQKLLKLEMLALNFGDSLSLAPLFLEVSRDIDKAKPAPDERMGWKVKKGELTGRLHRLAKRVAGSQLAALKPRGKPLHIEIPLETVKKTETAQQGFYTWPEDEVAQIAVGDAELAEDLKMELAQLTQGGITRILTFQFSTADYKQKTIEVALTVETINADGSLDNQPTEMSFNLDYYNFPLIDNTRLSDNQRFALVLSGFDENTVKVEGVLFPGEFSSQRDKPYLMDAIKALEVRATQREQGK
ncbi:hypothetical protein SAMN02745165_01405 [Malonomonas rubra DSM 5091]|uniref:Uncharacterized protein n=1 Tax=Malonomonas rubra DSM 5091 TaxID=1122189 RepID=A0A1M6G4I3_MALRU|nr:hypothetical protein [Malonomonas rubra]SHJ04833.1 hypothetical protein SAMN02745165_01405 [Malonomonas rubra DSM 5091]